jgi:hypothetical protein
LKISKQRAACLLAILLLSGANGQGEETKADFLIAPVKGMLKLFSELQTYYHDNQVEPAAKEQSISYLKDLDTSLSRLEDAKEDFTKALQKAHLPEDAEALQTRLNILSHSVSDLKHKLHSYISILPPDFQQSANQLENTLSSGLAFKAARLDDIANGLTGDASLTKDQLVKDGNDTVEEIKKLRSAVSALIQTLANSDKANKGSVS